MIRLLTGPDRVAGRERPRFDHLAFGERERPARPADPVSEALEQPVTGGALGHWHPNHMKAPTSSTLLHPGGQERADPPPPVGGIDGGVAPVAPRELGVGDQPVAIEDPDGAGGNVVAGTLPVADDVSLLDHDFADVLQLPCRDQCRHCTLVTGSHRTRHQAGWKRHARN